MKRKALWVALNGGAAILFWYGCIEGVEGAKNVLLFLVWITFVSSLCLLHDKTKASIVRKGRTFPAWVTVPYDIAMACALIWVGMWFSGTAYAFASMLQNSTYMSAEEGDTGHVPPKAPPPDPNEGFSP